MTDKYLKQLVSWKERRARMYKLWKEGLSYNQIALREHISPTRVGQIINKVEVALSKES